MTACSTALGVIDETMTRIIGGSAGGRRIATPRGANTRPTSDRVREALFSAIESWCGSLVGPPLPRSVRRLRGRGPRGLVARCRRGHAGRAGPSYRLDDLHQRPRARLLPRPRGRLRRRDDAAPPAGGAVRRGVPRPALRPSELLGRRRPGRPARARLARAGRDGDRRARLPRPPSRSGPRASRASREKKYGETDALVRSRRPAVTGPSPSPPTDPRRPRAPRRLPRVVRPGHQRAPRHRRAGRLALRRGRRRGRASTSRSTGCSPPTSGSRCCAERSATCPTCRSRASPGC